LSQPATIALNRVAELLLDTRMNEDSLYLRVARSAPQHRLVRGRPAIIVNVERVLAQHGGRTILFALLHRHPLGGHRREPDVRIKPDLVRSMARQHRATARLRDVADQKPRPTVLGRITRELLEQSDQVRVSPAAIAAEPHCLPVLPIWSDGDASGKAALGIEAVR